MVAVKVRPSDVALASARWLAASWPRAHPRWRGTTARARPIIVSMPMPTEIDRQSHHTTARDLPDRTANPAPLLRATCWGTRGSIPSPGPDTARFGGNTPCLEVRTREDDCLILDAGTGMRELGRRLAAGGQPIRAELFLSHFHWDHIQGFPFFAPLYDANTRLRIHGARQDGVDIKSILKGLMTPTYFPVPYEALSATIEFAHLDAGPWERPGVRVSAFRVRHQGHTYGFRIDADDVSLAYVPDDELVGGSYDVDDGWYDRLVEFLDGVDLLFHDAMFTDAEYPRRVGWGHSTFRQAVELAEAAGIRRLAFFHHAPERTDDELDRILDDFRDEVARRGSSLELDMAREGEMIALGGAP